MNETLENSVRDAICDALDVAYERLSEGDPSHSGAPTQYQVDQAARAALSVIQKDSVIVPREATDEMLKAACAAALSERHADFDGKTRAQYRAMLSVVE